MDREVQVWREGRAGRIRLNRPKAFNALNLDMVKAIRAAIDDFGSDPSVHVILVDTLERWFCAGGDVRILQARWRAIRASRRISSASNTR